MKEKTYYCHACNEITGNINDNCSKCLKPLPKHQVLTDKEKKEQAIKATITFAIIIIGLGWLYLSNSEPTEMSKERQARHAKYEAWKKSTENGTVKTVKAWKEDINLPVSKTLASNDIRGCGQYEYKKKETGHYLVKCTRNGVDWVYYNVWTNIDSVDGPYSSE